MTNERNPKRQESTFHGFVLHKEWPRIAITRVRFPHEPNFEGSSTAKVYLGFGS